MWFLEESLARIWITIFRLCSTILHRLPYLTPNDFQESGEYVPMLHQLPDACDISAKIKLLNIIKKAIEEELDWIM